MATTDPRVDAYIAQAPDYAQPILRRVRALVHKGCPDVEEAIKWRNPAFMYHGILCGMAAFKQYCTFGFWNGALELKARPMEQFGRLASLSDLPPDRVVVGYVREAARLNAAGIKRPPMPRRARKPLPVPKELASALKKHRRAKAVFAAFSPSHQREYSEWIGEARTDETRARRLATALEWIAAGKPRNWKYTKR